MRSTGGNKLTRGGKLETHGRTESGETTKVRTSTTMFGTRRTDTYSGGRGRPDGPGHGHKVTTETGFTTFSRQPSESRGLGLLDIIFGTAERK